MTKKDFDELAEQLAIVKREIDVDHAGFNPSEHDMLVATAAWQRCVYAVTLACKATSATFDRGRFIKACGIPNALGK